MPVPGDKHVLGLEVAVDEALLLGRREAARDLQRDLDGSPRGQGPASEGLPKRAALEQLRHHVAHALVSADVVHRQDVRMVERGDRPGLLFETPEPRSRA